MADELPMAIAPDGVVVQIKLDDYTGVDNACTYCYVDRMCAKSDDAHMESTLGADCTAYDRWEDDTWVQGVWKRVNDD